MKQNKVIEGYKVHLLERAGCVNILLLEHLEAGFTQPDCFYLPPSPSLVTLASRQELGSFDKSSISFQSDIVLYIVLKYMNGSKHFEVLTVSVLRLALSTCLWASSTPSVCSRKRATKCAKKASKSTDAMLNTHAVISSRSWPVKLFATM